MSVRVCCFRDAAKACLADATCSRGWRFESLLHYVVNTSVFGTTFPESLPVQQMCMNPNVWIWESATYTDLQHRPDLIS